ncbi:RagB/SusD family nutrient uptake outer membrane protein [Pedobacter alpinus]|uniref:RagB/SusD family nutrient uptake outer membrane protein n=1 Tax=Pedobacter alpinus TaxID=1590643 RepID=A0ABW5TVE7_9SPHI
MKKIIYILTIITAINFISGCKNTLDAPNVSALDASVVFSTPALAESALAGILQSFGETNSYRGRYLVNYGVNNDVEVYNSLKNITAEQARLSNYNTNVDNGQMNTSNNAWAKFYEAIERANLAIVGLRTYGNVQSNPQLAQILGEILTLRAVLYNDLVKGWGNVPARFEPITTETQYLPRSDKDVVYKQLLADLDEAAALLPWPNETATTSTVERVNKAFAKGLRARLALYAGGFSKHLDGQTRLSTDPDLAPDKMYAIAKQECLDIINSGKLRLLGFEEVFKTFNAETNRAGLESMWEIPFAEGRGRVIFDMGVRHTTVDKYTGQNRGGTDGVNPVMFFEYEKEDVRRDVTAVPYEWTNGVQVPVVGKFYFGKYRYEWLKRFVTSTNDDGLNWMYMRYADVILMAAEAINELDGPAAAAPYLKMIRTRAYPNNSAKVDAFMATASASKASFSSAIVDERALEFCGEMLRKADLIRWNLLSTKLNEAKTKLQQLDARQGKYANLPAKIYYRTAADGETVQIYGLNFGDTDAAGVLGGYTSNKTWTLSSSSDVVTYWNALFINDPNSQPVWPIWQFFIDNSNLTLDNKNF